MQKRHQKTKGVGDAPEFGDFGVGGDGIREKTEERDEKRNEHDDHAADSTRMKKTRKTGRKSKLTEEVQAAIVQAVEAGNYRHVAAEAAGVHKATFYRWMKAGEKEREGELRDFCDAVKKAERKAELRIVGVIETAALSTWQAGAWLLERRHPLRWGRIDRTRVKLSGKVEHHTEGDELDRLIDALAKRETESG